MGSGLSRCLKFLTIIKWGSLFAIVVVAIFAVSLLVTEYREQKILRVTFDNSDYYKPLLPLASYEKNTIVLFGDSRIKQWNPLPKIEGVDILNRGISEETTAQMMLRFKKDVLDIEPDIVIIQAGINDLVAASIADYELKNRIYKNSISNLEKMVDQAVKQEIIVIFFKVVEPYELGLIRSVLWGDDLRNLVQTANEELLKFSDKSNVYVFDANKALHQKDQWKPDVNRGTLHFTAKAYQLLNDEVIRLVAAIYK